MKVGTGRSVREGSPVGLSGPPGADPVGRGGGEGAGPVGLGGGDWDGTGPLGRGGRPVPVGRGGRSVPVGRGKPGPPVGNGKRPVGRSPPVGRGKPGPPVGNGKRPVGRGAGAPSVGATIMPPPWATGTAVAGWRAAAAARRVIRMRVILVGLGCERFMKVEF